MRSFELVRFALGAIIAHPMRSVLTSLGVVIGVAAVVMMTSIGLGASKRVTEAICETLAIKPGETDASGTFTMASQTFGFWPLQYTRVVLTGCTP